VIAGTAEMLSLSVLSRETLGGIFSYATGTLHTTITVSPARPPHRLIGAGFAGHLQSLIRRSRRSPWLPPLYGRAALNNPVI
jgi:hypothetical protein